MDSAFYENVLKNVLPGKAQKDVGMNIAEKILPEKGR
jgi:hypothetical protein